MHVGKASEDVIHLLGTPVPAAEQKPLAAIVEAIAGTGGSGHFLPFVNAKSPDVPGEVDIATIVRFVAPAKARGSSFFEPNFWVPACAGTTAVVI
jgi:hypothetical protein